MRSAVIVAVDGDVAIGVQLRRLPLAAVILNRRQRLECGFLDLLEPFTSRDAKATVGLLVDALDADHQRAIDLGGRSQSGATIPEAKVATQYFYQSFHDCLIAGPPHAR